MRLRAAHFACVLLLLSSLGAAKGATPRAGYSGLGAHYIGILLHQHAVQACEETPLSLAASEASAIVLPASERALYRAAWTMRPPSAQAVALHAFTGSAV